MLERSRIIGSGESLAKGSTVRRRTFLQSSGASLAALLASVETVGARVAFGANPREIHADVAILGGGVGGCAAALAALSRGRSVVMTEPTRWIGGQWTSQAVPPDEHPWIEQFGANASYRALRQEIRQIYRRSFPLTARAARNARLNPGNGSVSRLCHEPRVALMALVERFAPYLSSGRLVILLEHDVAAASVEGDRVRSVDVVAQRSGARRAIIAPYFLDATELGDLLPLAGVEHVVGAEAQSETGEPHAAATRQPLNQQSVTACFAMEYREGEDHVGDPPAEYAFWRDYAPGLSPAWPGKLLDRLTTDPVTRKPVDRGFNPQGEGAGLWVYRRIVDPRNFEPGAYAGSSGVTLVNWPQNDYMLGPLIGPGVTAEAAARHAARARQLSLSLFHWLQTECPRPDGKTGWRGLKLRGDLLGSDDGLAQALYIRESRRILAEFTVLEQHVGLDARRTELKRQDVTAAPFTDSVGTGAYRIDLHPSTGGDNYIDIGSLPFQIPLGALIPRRVENLLPACKNLGTTHLSNGCYRLHPVEWAIGEAAGALAAFCLETHEIPRGIRSGPKRLAAFQSLLRSMGAELEWPKITPR